LPAQRIRGNLAENEGFFGNKGARKCPCFLMAWIENTDDTKAGTPTSYQELVPQAHIDFLPDMQ
jgi:hypothetical protein